MAALWLGLLGLSAVALAEIRKGPYLLSPSSDSMTVCWTANSNAAGFFLFSPADADRDATPRRIETAPVALPGGELRHCASPAGLAPATAYRYSAAAGDSRSAEYEFRTAPAPGEPFRFVVYGDNQRPYTGYPNEAHVAVVDAVREAAPDFVVHMGDMVRKGNSEESWAQFFREMAPIVATTPLVPVYGNHERAGDRDGTRYAGYFPVRNENDTPLWYVVRYAGLAMVVLDLEEIGTIRKPGAPQREWLEKRLAEVRYDPGITLVMGFFHRPAFSWVPGRSRQNTARDVVSPLLARAGARLIWSSHDHLYARAHLNGVEHVISGGGGAGLYALAPGVERFPEYKANAMAYHYCVVDVDVRAVRVQAVEVPGGAVLDHFEIPVGKSTPAAAGAGANDGGAAGGSDDPPGPAERPCGCGG